MIRQYRLFTAKTSLSISETPSLTAFTLKIESPNGSASITLPREDAETIHALLNPHSYTGDFIHFKDEDPTKVNLEDILHEESHE